MKRLSIRLSFVMLMLMLCCVSNVQAQSGEGTAYLTLAIEGESTRVYTDADQTAKEAWNAALADVNTYCKDHPNDEVDATLTLYTALLATLKGPVSPFVMDKENLVLTIDCGIKDKVYKTYAVQCVINDPDKELAFVTINAGKLICKRGILQLYKYGNKNYAYPTIMVNDGGTLELRGGTIKNDHSNGSGIQVNQGGKAYIYDGTIQAERDIYYTHSESDVKFYGGTFNLLKKSAKAPLFRKAAASTSSKQYSYLQDEANVSTDKHAFVDCIGKGVSYLYTVTRKNGATDTLYTSRDELVDMGASNSSAFFLGSCRNHNGNTITPIKKDGVIDDTYHLAGCSNCNDIDQLKHNYTSTYKPDYTCTTDGMRYDTCECGATRQVFLPAAHRNDSIAGIPATCNNSGHTGSIICLKCGYVEKEDEFLPQLKHKMVFESASNDKSCVLSLKYVCEYGCGKDSIAAKEGMSHNWSSPVYNDDATCYRRATIVRHCINAGCEATTTSYQIDKPMKSHHLKFVAGCERTCTTDGMFDHYICDNEGCDYMEFTTDNGVKHTTSKKNFRLPWYMQARGHHFDRRVVSDATFRQEATCSRPARYRFTCNDCDEIEDIEASSHGNTHYFEHGTNLDHKLTVAGYTVDKYYIHNYYASTFSSFQDYVHEYDPSEANCSVMCEREGCGFYAEVPLNKANHQLLSVETLQAPTCQPGVGRYNYRFLGGDKGFWKYFQLTEFSFENEILPELNEDGTFKTHAYDADGYCPYHGQGDYVMSVESKDDNGNVTRSFYNDFKTGLKDYRQGEIKLYRDVELKDENGKFLSSLNLGYGGGDLVIDLNGYSLKGGAYIDEYYDCESFTTLDLGYVDNVVIKNGTVDLMLNSSNMKEDEGIVLDNVKGEIHGMSLYGGSATLKNGTDITAYEDFTCGGIDIDETSRMQCVDIRTFGGYDKRVSKNGSEIAILYPTVQQALHYLDANEFQIVKSEYSANLYTKDENGGGEQARNFTLEGINKTSCQMDGPCEHIRMYVYSEGGYVDEGHLPVCSICGAVDAEADFAPHQMSTDGLRCTQCNFRYRVADEFGNKYATLGELCYSEAVNNANEPVKASLLCDHDKNFSRTYRGLDDAYLTKGKGVVLDLCGYDIPDWCPSYYPEDDIFPSIVNSAERMATIGGLEIENISWQTTGYLTLGSNICVKSMGSYNSASIKQQLSRPYVHLTQCVSNPENYNFSYSQAENVCFTNPNHCYTSPYLYNSESGNYERHCAACDVLLQTMGKNAEGQFALSTLTLSDIEECAFEKPIEVETLTLQRTFPSQQAWQSLYVPVRIPIADVLDAGMEAAVINQFHQTDTNDDGVLDTWYLEVRMVNDRDAVLRANTPYVIRLKEGAGSTGALTVENATVEQTQIKSFKVNTMDYQYTFKGNYSYQNADGYAVNNEGVITSVESITPQRWLLNIKEQSSKQEVTSNEVHIFIIATDEDGQPTDISEMGEEKVGIHAIYTPDGKRVSRLQRGINILQLEDGTNQKILKK